jgi:hypothetical protein
MTQEVPELPPLPEPKWIAIDTDGADFDVTFVPTRHQAQDILIDIPEEHRSSAELYTADQMRAYAREALSQAVADAQRYRYMRDRMIFWQDGTLVLSGIPWGSVKSSAPENIDTAIDAAMRQGAQA